MARRVSSAGVLVEQKGDINYRRVGAAGVMVEQKGTPNYLRIYAAGILVETKPADQVVPSGIASAEAFGTPEVIPGSVTLYAQGIASTEAFGTSLITIGIPNFTLEPTGIGSAESFGTPVITQINYSTFNEYIVLDGKRYRSVHKTWSPEVLRPMTSRELLNGNLDATFGASSTLVWEGELVAPITVDDSNWGTAANLRTTLKKKTTVSYTDHYGTVYSIANLIGPFPERSASPIWDDHPIYIKIKIKAKA